MRFKSRKRAVGVRGTEEEIFHLLVRSPNGRNHEDWAKPKPGTGSSNQHSPGVAGTQVFGPSSTAFPGGQQEVGSEVECVGLKPALPCGLLALQVAFYAQQYCPEWGFFPPVPMSGSISYVTGKISLNFTPNQVHGKGIGFGYNAVFVTMLGSS